MSKRLIVILTCVLAVSLTGCVPATSGADACVIAQPYIDELNQAKSDFSESVTEENKQQVALALYENVEATNDKLYEITSTNPEVNAAIQNVLERFDKFSSVVLQWGNGAIEDIDLEIHTSYAAQAINDFTFLCIAAP